MWHALKGSDYTLDLDHEKILTACEVFENCMKDYFVPPEAMPFTTGMGLVYDSGQFARHLDAALAQADQDGFAARKAASARNGKLRGFGYAYYIEACGYGVGDAATVRIDRDGGATVLVGNQSNGQGHETVFAQIVAERTGLDLDAIEVVTRWSFSTTWLAYGIFAAIPLLAFAWRSARSRPFFVRSAVILNVATATTTLLLAPRPWAALQCLALGLALLSYGYIRDRRPALYAGISLAAFGFLVEVAHAVEFFQPSGWLALAGFGFSLMGLTAWLERRSRAAKLSQELAPGLPQ